MKALSLCLSLCLAVAPSGAMESHRGNIITLTDQEIEACDEGGGLRLCHEGEAARGDRVGGEVARGQLHGRGRFPPLIAIREFSWKTPA